MTAELNSLERIRLYYEYTEDDAFHDLLIKRMHVNDEIKRTKLRLKRVYAVAILRKVKKV